MASGTRTEIPLVVIESDGDAVANASVQVNIRGGGAATVYSAETGAGTLSNPLTSDATGRVVGWLDRGAYNLVVTAAGLTTYTEPYDSVPGVDGGIDTAALADSAVTSAKIADATIATADIANSAVTTAKIATLPSARVYNSANISVTNAAWNTLTFNSERWDTDTIHSTVTNTGRLTATTAGKYVITGTATWDTSATGIRGIGILLNGATFIVTVNWPSAGTVAGTQQNVTTIHSLAATDYVELQGWQNSGGSLNVLALGNYSPEFMMHWIGP